MDLFSFSHLVQQSPFFCPPSTSSTCPVLLSSIHHLSLAIAPSAPESLPPIPFPFLLPCRGCPIGVAAGGGSQGDVQADVANLERLLRMTLEEFVGEVAAFQPEDWRSVAVLLGGRVWRPVRGRDWRLSLPLR